MKTRLILSLVLALCIPVTMFAQGDMAAVSKATSSMNMGEMLTTLANGIKEDGFNKSWSKNKAEWMNSVKNLKMDDVASYGKKAAELVGNLKSTSFTKGFDVAGLTKSLSSSMDMKSLAGSVGSLTKGLDKSVLTEDFTKNYDKFLGSLDMLK